MNHQEVREAISRGCPEFRVDSIRYLDEGDFCRAYIINDEWVFRVAKHDAARQSLRREYCLLPRLADRLALQIPSPRIAGFDEKAELLFTAYRLLPGTCLSQQLYLSLDALDRTHCAEQVAIFLTQLHSIDLSPAHACGVPVRHTPEQYSGLL